ncbi:hypothetical protein RQP46_006629 [Phenoliferia psychrophenolica]
MAEQASTAAAPTDAPTDSPAPDAQSLLAQGIKSLALKKYDQACDSLSRAVEALTEVHGELAPEVAEAMVLYGKALLYNAIAQSAVLGGAPGKAEETEEAVQNAVAGPSTATPVTAQSIQFSFGGDAEDDGEDEEGDEDDEDEDGPGAGDKEDDLESAFLMLDTARAIYSKDDSRDSKLKLGDVHRLLGDVATEGGQFDSAVTEYTEALLVLSTILEPYDRALSELHMLIALALDFVPDEVDRAVSHAEKAKAVLLLKLTHLEKMEKTKRTDKEEREITDIKEIMGDVDMKIEDLKVVPEAAPQTEAEKALEAVIRNATGPKAAGIVNNLNSLVKKKKPVPVQDGASGSGEKRKADEASAQGDEKKAKVDESAAETS